MKKDQMTYADTGVDYDVMDPFKRTAQIAASETGKNILRFGYFDVKESRGESVHLIEMPDCYLAHVEEGLGTKNLVAEEILKLMDISYYDHIAQDTVAMIVNDMITLGALPLSVAMHLAVGESEWFRDENRSTDIVFGWKRACGLARTVWGGGETPTLPGVVVPGTIVLSGSATGIIKPKGRRILGNVQHGDAIIFLESSGIHANGLTLARKIAEKLPKKFLTRVNGKRTYGEMLLDATHIYVPFIEDCLDNGIDIHYAVNITGHGWRKLMRLPAPFAYIIERLPRQLPIFDFIQQNGPVDDREAYGNFNMGAGFAIYIPERDVKKTLAILQPQNYPFSGYRAGHIEASTEKKVVIVPKNLEYSGVTLGVR